MIVLVHPKHGEKIAYLEEEARVDRLNGWTDKPKESKEEKPKRRGRPPKVKHDDN